MSADLEDLFQSVLEAIVKGLWNYRIELVLAGAVAGLYLWVASTANRTVAAVALAVVVVVVAGTRRIRRLVVRLLVRAHVRRRWHWAVAKVRPKSFGDANTTVYRVREIPAGHVLRIGIPHGATVSEIDDRAEAIAAVLKASDVRVTRDPADASRATVTVLRRDPLASPTPLCWPNSDASRLSLWDPIPVGVDELGQPVQVGLAEHNVLIGGEPGAGKSVAMSLFVATAALDPTVTLWLFDGKLVELAPWARCATRTVGFDVGDAVAALTELVAEMDLRYTELLANGVRKVTPDTPMGLHVVVIDELALYTAGHDRAQRDEFNGLLRAVVSRGRAAGIIVVAATQKPAADVVPTSLRDLFGYRWAMRCATREASDTILGSGWATQGFTASSVDAAQRGVGYLLHEGNQPIRLRAGYLDDHTIDNIAQRASRLRAPDTCIEAGHHAP